MTCIKTGAHVYLEQYNEWAYGDVHLFGTAHILRVAQIEIAQPIYSHKHFTFHDVSVKWNDKPYGTIVSLSATNHGYEGVPV